MSDKTFPIKLKAAIRYFQIFSAAAHLDAVTKLCEKIVLIRRLQIEPDVMTTMLTNRGFFDHSAHKGTGEAVYTGTMSQNWEKVLSPTYFYHNTRSYMTSQKSYCHFSIDVDQGCCASSGQKRQTRRGGVKTCINTLLGSQKT